MYTCWIDLFILALESAHAVWGTIQMAKTLPKEANIVMVRSRLAVDTFLRLTFCTVSFRSRRQGCRTDFADAAKVGRQARLAHRLAQVGPKRALE